jgi:hypothetical protein
MKKLFILLILTCALTASQAQNIPFTISKSMTFQDDYKNSNIVLSEVNDKKELVIVRSYNGTTVFSQGQGFYVEKYDERLDLKKSFDYELKHDLNSQKYNLIVGIFAMENNVHFVEICYDLNEKAYVCFDNILSDEFKITTKELFKLPRDIAKQIGIFNLQEKSFSRNKAFWPNSNSGAIKSENESASLNAFSGLFFSPIGSNFKYKRALEVENSGVGSDIILVVNESKTAFAIALDGKSQENDGIQLYLFDNNLNKKIDMVYGSSLKDKKNFFQNLIVSETGDAIFLIAKSYAPSLKKKEEGGKYFYDFSKITSDKQFSHKIEIGEHYIGSLKTYYHNNELISVGFYSDKNDNTYSGICHFILDENTLTLKSSKYNPFSSQFLIDKYGSAKQRQLKTFNFKKAFFNSSNEIIINAEENYITSVQHTTTGNPMFGPTAMHSVTYSYDDIVIAKIDGNGDLIWARNINKKQSASSEDSGYLSYTSTFRNGKNYLFINSREEVKKLSNDRIEFRQIRKNKSNLNMITVSENGDFDYQEILDDAENSVPYMVSRGIASDNSVYFLGRKGSDKQILKIGL